MNRLNKCFLIIFLFMGLIFIGCGKKSLNVDVEKTKELPNDSEHVKLEFGIWLNEGVVCKNVVNHKPQEPSLEYNTDNAIKVYCFTKIGCHKPGQLIYHRYSVLRERLSKEQGIWEEVHITELSVKSTNFRTWSYKTVFPNKWRVDVLAPDKKSVIKSYVFKIKAQKAVEKPDILDINDSYDISQIELIESELCENVENNVPINPSLEFILNEQENYKKVWIWMKFKCENFPTKVFLRWNRWVKCIEGNDGWSPEIITSLDVKGRTWRTRGYKSCGIGKWRLDILAGDGKTIMKFFEFIIQRKEKVL